MSDQNQEKIPLSVVKKMPYKMLNRLILKAKNHLKNDPVWKELCDQYNEDVDIIDLIPTMFGSLEVSGKTEKGVVILNYQLLCDGDFVKDISYLIHEYTHFFQQCYGDKATKSSDSGDYLHNPAEQEGFANQVNYIANQEGEDEAEQYVDDLLEHHDKSGDTADKLKDKLMDKI